MAALAVAALLLQAARAQQAGTLKAEEHLPLPVARCGREKGCVMEHGEVTLDAQWRWAHDGESNDCFVDGGWNPSLCSDPTTCASRCQLEGLDKEDYADTYGVSETAGGLKLDFAVPGGSVGSRLYLMSDENHFKMFNLKNREFTFDVDVSSLPCGLNGAIYFVEMETGGSWNGAGNLAGAKFGTGYCDAQCPRDLKFIGGQANTMDWNSTSATGLYGACCAELDIFEANREASAYTVHPCERPGLDRCNGTAEECGRCDESGCDFNSYRMGDRSFYGPGSFYDVDTTLPVTVVTQFLTSDGTDAGDLVEIRRLYVQGGKIVHNSASPILGREGGHSITDEYCSAKREAFNEDKDFKVLGGLKAMGQAMDRGMVLVLSIWDDDATGMTWLDSYSAKDKKKKSKPGVARGPCSPAGGGDKELRVNHPGAAVTYSNLAYGEIDSTYVKAQDRPRKHEKPKEDFCCLAAANQQDACGTCYSSAVANAETFCGQSEGFCMSCGALNTWCSASSGRVQVEVEPVGGAEGGWGGKNGKVDLTLEGRDVPPSLAAGDMVTMTIGGKEMHVQVISAPANIALPRTSGYGGGWGFIPVLQRYDAGARVAALGRRYGILPVAGTALAGLAAAGLLVAAAVRVYRRPAMDNDGRGLPLTVSNDEEVMAESPARQLHFDSPVRRRSEASFSPSALP